MTYKDRVQKKAEEFARLMFDMIFENLPNEEYEKVKTLAEKAVRDEGEAYWAGRESNEDEKSGELVGYTYYDFENDRPVVMTPEEFKKDHLQQLGYLKTEEHG